MRRVMAMLTALMLVICMAGCGSKDDNTADFLAAVDPQIILLSNRLASREAYMVELTGDTPLYSTESSGAVTVRFLGDGEFTVQPYR